MTGEDKNKISSWQKSFSEDESNPSNDISLDAGTSLSRDELLEQAKQFLDDESVRSAPYERKVAFLKRKGLTSNDIEQLLNTENKTTSGTEDMKTVHDSTGQRTTRSESQTVENPLTNHSEQTLQAKAPQAITPPRDAPPIITYPEFLLKPSKPPPLVTFQRLLYAGYGLAGVSAMLYGASKFLVEPMLQTLTEARHNLAGHTLEEIEKLNKKLESSVSHLPYSATIAALKAQRDREEDEESIDSDPTELFHRDIATQTSPQLSRSSSSNSLAKTKSLNATNHQVERLQSLHTTLQDLVADIDPSSDSFMQLSSINQLHDTTSQLQAILDKLESTYNPFRSDLSTLYSSTNFTTAPTPTTNKSDNNEAAKFKAEIRSLKGAFLSSRNFPAARPTGYNPTTVR